ncbi:MAG: hypothetical protein V3S25_11125 [Nitrospirales bacterium]
MPDMTEKIVALYEGDEIVILVGGHPVLTVIDEHGVQRFVPNSAIDHLFREGRLDMHQLTIDFYKGSFHRDGFIDLYMDLGYSVGGFNEVWGPSSSYFDNTGEYVEIVNPVWIDEAEMAQELNAEAEAHALT